MHIKFGLIGNKINYSLSPLIHNYWFKYYGIKATYNKIDISTNMLNKEYIISLLKNNYKGFNITIPYKEIITLLFNTKNEVVSKIKAANTLYIKDNKIFLNNTDYLGFIISLILQNYNHKFNRNDEINISEIVKKFNLYDKEKKICIFKNSYNALIIGAGGSAKAIIYALLRSNINKIFILNRNIDKALNLYELFKNDKLVVIKDLNEINNIILLVNCTPLESNFYFDEKFYKFLNKDSLFFDLTYNPLKTNFLNTAYNYGYKTLNGLLMLIIQAAFSFENWFNFLPKIDRYLMDLVNKELNKY